MENKEKFGGFKRSIIEHRERLYAAKPLAQPAEVFHFDILVPLKKDVKIPARIYRPNSHLSKYPTIFYVPGTAFVAQETVFTEVICSHLAEKSKAQVIVINHRLAPEDQFPKGLNDAYGVLQFFLGTPESVFKIDQSRVVMIGYSSGGNFAASMAIRAKMRGIPIAKQILISPLTDLSRSLQDFKEKFEDKDTVITNAFVEWFLNLYLPEGMNHKNPWVSPFFHQENHLKGLPSTDIIFAEYDRFRSDAEGYYEKLKKADVSINRFMIENENHSFLWYKLEIIEKIGTAIQLGFGLQSIDRPKLNALNHLYFIKPSLEPNPENMLLDTNQDQNQKPYKFPSKL